MNGEDVMRQSGDTVEAVTKDAFGCGVSSSAVEHALCVDASSEAATARVQVWWVFMGASLRPSSLATPAPFTERSLIEVQSTMSDCSVKRV
jgi:hypothetical protein